MRTQEEHLYLHEVPSQVWQSISTNLFEMQGKQDLLLIDGYSYSPLVEQMPEPVTNTMITQKIWPFCSLFGNPKEVMSTMAHIMLDKPSNHSLDHGEINMQPAPHDMPEVTT